MSKSALITGITGQDGSYLAELLRPLAVEVTSVSATDAAKGSLPEGTFSLVVIDGAIEQLPEALAATIEDQGRIVSGLLLRGVTRLATGRKVGGHVSLLPVEDIGIPVLHGFDAPKGWTFS